MPSSSSRCPPERADRRRRLLGGELVPGEGLEDLLSGPDRSRWLGRRLVRLIGVAGSEAQCANERLDPGANGRIADPELALHVTQVAARSEEALEQRHLVAVETTEPANAEVALEGRAAAPAMEARDGQLARTDRAGGDDVVRHRRPRQRPARAGNPRRSRRGAAVPALVVVVAAARAEAPAASRSSRRRRPSAIARSRSS